MLGLKLITGTVFLTGMAGMIAGVAAAPPPAGIPPYNNTSEWTQRPDRGWHFFDDPVPEPESDVPAPSSPTTGPEQLQQWKKELEDARATAIMTPTRDNVMRYIVLQQKTLAQANEFSKTYTRVFWERPELGVALEHPASAVGVALDQQLTRDKQRDAVMQLADTKGLFFFFKRSCPYCEAQAPILRNFAAQYGLQVVAISLDGSRLPEFPDSRADNGLAAELGVRATPAIFMVDPYQRNIMLLAYGLLTESELLSRIEMLLQDAASSKTHTSEGLRP